MGNLLKLLRNSRRCGIIVLTPLVLATLPILVNTSEAKCAFVIILMAVYWMTEVIPMAVTALLPTLLFPVLGVVTAKQISQNYFKDTIMLFVGGLIVAVAIEYWKLHKRIALRVLMLVGSQPKWLMFGFMVTTAFLSMWISNTASTAMMVPIVNAVLMELKERTRTNKTHFEANNNENSLENMEDGLTSSSLLDGKAEKDYTKERKFNTMCKGMTICVAYAASIGGVSTITGTGANLVLKGQVETLFGDEAGLTFGSWFIFAFPVSVSCLFFSWFWLQVRFFGIKSVCNWSCQRNDESEVSKIIRKEYAKLGPITFPETAVLVHFVLLALLWITREPEFVPGWGKLFKHGYVSDSVPSILIAVLLFTCPSKLPAFLKISRKSKIMKKDMKKGKTDSEQDIKSGRLLDWRTVSERLPWGVVLVIGGGFAMADACKKSGLSYWLGQQFVIFRSFPSWALVLVVSIVIACFTEITSNIATTTIFLPILAQIALSIGINPLYLMIPANFATSFAFMLPVATPPNAIVFSYGHLKVRDMMQAGAVLNILCIIVLNVAINTWGMAYFHLNEYPQWAVSADMTGKENITDILTYVTTNKIGNETLNSLL